jgi:GTP cyclohydrolase I
MEIKYTNPEINRHKISWHLFYDYCGYLLSEIKQSGKKYQVIYPIPKNGLFVAQRLSEFSGIPIECDFAEIETYGKEDVLIVDDLVDSGRTLEKYVGYDKAVLFVKNNHIDKVTYYLARPKKGIWIQFPWEKENDIEDSLIRMLEYIGENPTREGLAETPIRIIRSWEKLYGGYNESPEAILKTFTEGACDEMVILKDIEFYSTCEHHFLPFFGKIAIGYLPNQKVVGVSKLARLVEIFARRLQIQERLVAQIADSLLEHLRPLGVMVIAEAQHLCMTARGVEKQKSMMISSAIRGVFKEDLGARQEFLNLIK